MAKTNIAERTDEQLPPSNYVGGIQGRQLPSDATAGQLLAERIRCVTQHVLTCRVIAEEDGQDPDLETAIWLAEIGMAYAGKLLEAPHSSKRQRAAIQKLYAVAWGIEGPNQRQKARERQRIVASIDKWSALKCADKAAASLAIQEAAKELRHNLPLIAKLREAKALDLLTACIASRRAANAIGAKALVKAAAADKAGKVAKLFFHHIGVGGTLKSVTRARKARTRGK